MAADPATLFNTQDPAPPVVTPPVVTPPVVTPPPADPSLLNPPPVDPPAPEPGAWLTAFKDLPADVAGDPSLKAITGVENLIKSYVAGQKMIGADKLVIPAKHATDDEWQGIFQKLGNPAKLEDYTVKAPDNLGAEDSYFKGFLENAHKAGILPQQAQKIVDYHTQFSTDHAKELQSRAEQTIREEVDAFKQAEGANYNDTMLKAKTVISQFDDDEKTFTNLMTNDAGIGNNTKLYKFLSRVGAALTEDHFRGDNISNLGTTAEEASQKISTIRGQKDHAYWNKDHPDHKRAVDEMSKLTTQSMQA